MSSPFTSARVRSRLPVPAAKPRLAVVPSNRPPGHRIPFAGLVVGALALGLAGLLVLNTSLQRSAFVVTNLRDRAAALSIREQGLRAQVLRLDSPQRLAAVAVADGMVHVDSPNFLSLKTGKVTGVRKPIPVPNPSTVFGGRRSASAGKLPLLPAGTSNGASSGLQHEVPALPPSPRASTPTKPRGSASSSHKPASSTHKSARPNGRTQ